VCHLYLGQQSRRIIISCMKAVVSNPAKTKQDWVRAEQEILKQER